MFILYVYGSTYIDCIYMSVWMMNDLPGPIYSSLKYLLRLYL